MSFEETLVCDGCSTVLDGGTRRAMLETLKAQGGRSFLKTHEGGWDEHSGPSWLSDRHLCGGCVRDNVEEFFDGSAAPKEER